MAAKVRTEEKGASYREVIISLESGLGADERSFLLDVEKRFPRTDFSFAELGPERIVINLRSVALDDLKACLEQGDEPEKEEAAGPPAVGSKIIRAIENIRSYGIQGKKRVYVGYNAERKVKGRKQKEATTGKHFYATDNPFSKQNNDFPVGKADKGVCGDAQDVLRSLPDNCVDLILTSPPYNFGLDYESSTDGIEWQRYFEKLFAVFEECIRVLKYGGRIVVNVQPLFSSYIPSHHFVSNFFTSHKLIWKGEILWEKNNYNCKYTAWGSWKSPSNPYLKYTWEFLEIFAKGSLRKQGRREDIDITAEEFKKWVVAKWSIAPEKDMNKYEHPAMFPEELAYRAIKLFSFENDVVLDPFNGAGTSTAVARHLGRRFLGIDISKDYCDTARRRTHAGL